MSVCGMPETGDHRPFRGPWAQVYDCAYYHHVRRTDYSGLVDVSNCICNDFAFCDSNCPMLKDLWIVQTSANFALSLMRKMEGERRNALAIKAYNPILAARMKSCLDLSKKQDLPAKAPALKLHNPYLEYLNFIMAKTKKNNAMKAMVKQEVVKDVPKEVKKEVKKEVVQDLKPTTYEQRKPQKKKKNQRSVKTNKANMPKKYLKPGAELGLFIYNTRHCLNNNDGRLPAVPDNAGGDTMSATIGYTDDILLLPDPDAEEIFVAVAPGLKRCIAVSGAQAIDALNPTLGPTMNAGATFAQPGQENKTNATESGYCDDTTVFTPLIGTVNNSSTTTLTSSGGQQGAYTIPLAFDWPGSTDNFSFRQQCKNDGKGFYNTFPKNATSGVGLLSNTTAAQVNLTATANDQLGASANGMTMQLWGSTQSTPTFSNTGDTLIIGATCAQVGSGSTWYSNLVNNGTQGPFNLSTYQSLYVVIGVAAGLQLGTVLQDFGVAITNLIDPNSSTPGVCTAFGTNGSYVYDSGLLKSIKAQAKTQSDMQKYRWVCKDATLENRTPLFFKGGDIVVNSTPSTRSSAVYQPISYTNQVAKIGNYTGDAANGGHSYCKPNSFPNYQLYRSILSDGPREGDPVLIFIVRLPKGTDIPASDVHIIVSGVWQFQTQNPINSPSYMDGLWGHRDISAEQFFENAINCLKCYAVSSENPTHEEVTKWLQACIDHGATFVKWFAAPVGKQLSNIINFLE